MTDYLKYLDEQTTKHKELAEKAEPLSYVRGLHLGAVAVLEQAKEEYKKHGGFWE